MLRPVVWMLQESPMLLISIFQRYLWLQVKVFAYRVHLKPTNKSWMFLKDFGVLAGLTCHYSNSMVLLFGKNIL